MEHVELDREFPLLEFDQVYPIKFQEISKIHWTPVEVIELAVEWLIQKDETKILDIGSGVGKFCIVGALISKAKFTGIEKREYLFEEALKVKNKIGVNNVEFINDNITNFDFKNYNSFYYYNPFCEQIATTDLIDNSISYSENKFELYQEYVSEQFKKAAIGTKIVTYCSDSYVIPSGYALSNLNYNGLLQLWIKEY